ncbi:hypothetical protein CHCC14527_2195 [Bacillus paralicheniformis]|nr:hypothetical protein CHCC14527_2195 [Bacillus paralicheniformis]
MGKHVSIDTTKNKRVADALFKLAVLCSLIQVSAVLQEQISQSCQIFYSAG